MKTQTIEALQALGLTPWPIPAPESGAERCGCRAPLIWDDWWGFWRHLSSYPDLETRCLPRASRR